MKMIGVNYMENIYEKVSELMQANSKLAIATVINTSGSTPREIGAKMLILPDGTTQGTVGGGKLEHKVTQDAVKAMQDGTSGLMEYDLKPEDSSGIGMECGGKVSIFIEVISKGQKLLILGGGHIGLELYRMAVLAGFSVVVVDERSEYMSSDRFPKAERLLNCTVDDPKVSELVDNNTYIVIITHEHKQDKLAVKSLVELDYKYLGMIGSKRKVKITLEALENEGISKEKLKDIYTPIGLDIKARTPAEIAVSIMAEIIFIKNTGLRPEHSMANKL
jgi:xanthine dehydrogenase accessory factor